MTFDLQAAAATLKAAGIEDPLREARILAKATREPDTFQSYIKRRATHEPVAYIVGRREFWSLDFEVSPAVLIPRPDSETLVETALGELKARPPGKILDLGTGSGCLLIALLTEWPQSFGCGVDLSVGALDIARRNAVRLGVSSRIEFRQADFAEAIDQKFDLIISNPPYIPDGIVSTLDPDVQNFEPHLALKGGADGLMSLHKIARTLPLMLAAGSPAIVEIGFDQAAAASQILQNQGLHVVRVVKDLGHNDRVVVATMPQ